MILHGTTGGLNATSMATEIQVIPRRRSGAVGQSADSCHADDDESMYLTCRRLHNAPRHRAREGNVQTEKRQIDKRVLLRAESVRVLGTDPSKSSGSQVGVVSESMVVGNGLTAVMQSLQGHVEQTLIYRGTEAQKCFGLQLRSKNVNSVRQAWVLRDYTRFAAKLRTC